MARKQLVYGFLTAFAMAVLSMCGPLTAAQEPTAEVWERAEALGREIQACGSNAMCIREVQRRMEEFNQELVEAYGGPQFPSPQELMEQEAMMQEIDQALAKRRGDPCYPVYHVKETGRRVRGSDLPWISCTPLEIRVRWEVEEHQSSSLPLNASLTIEESYPGYLETVRGEDDRQHLISYEIRGPSESDPSSAVTRGSVTLTGYEVQGFPWDVIYTHRNFGTRNPADFSVDPSHSRLTFRYLRMEPPQSRVYEHRLTVDAPTVTVHVPAGGSELREIFYISDVALDGSNGFTPEEIGTGLRIGHLMKTFPVRSEFSIPPYYSMQQKGKVTVTVLFDPRPGILAVTPNTPFEPSGPNSNNRFTPASQTYRLNNKGESDLSWQAVENVPWLELSATGGTLKAGQETSLEARITEQARRLEDGTYKTDLRFKNLTSGQGSTKRQVVLEVGKEERWRLHLSGYDTDQFPVHVVENNQWIKSTCGIRFNYTLWADFTVRKRKGKWQYKHGTITRADVGIGSLYTAPHWQLKPAQCQYCNQIEALEGTVIDGMMHTPKSVQLFWPDLRPRVEIEAKLLLPCKPMPECAAWGKTRLYISDNFMDRAGDFIYPLQHGYSDNKRVERPSDHLRWVNYDYRLRRLYP